MTKHLNKADKTLVLAAALFIFFLALNIELKGNMLADFLLFVSEAALVGGIADWFAVTALFKKPLGFPYHTALLPKKRKELTDATIIMVEQEFFSRKKIIYHLKNFEVFSFMISFLKSDNIREEILNLIVSNLNELKYSGKDNIIESFKAELPKIILKFLSNLRKSGEDRELLKKCVIYLKAKVETDEFREVIYNAFKNFEAKKVEDELNFLLNIAAKSFGVVDFDEGTNIFQEKFAKFFEDAEKNAKAQDDILALLHKKANEFLTSEENFDARNEWINEIFTALSAEKNIENILRNLSENDFKITLKDEYSKMINLIENDGHIHNIFEHLIYDVIARSALYAQGKTGEIVTDAISALTDEELNRIVYEKVEDDLLWIRMNGSIVGAIVGAVMKIIIILI